MMHNNPVLAQVIPIGFPFKIQWFMQDGATPHTANVLDFMQNTFSPKVTSHHFPDHHVCGQN
jgi:hypothetical protein